MKEKYQLFRSATIPKLGPAYAVVTVNFENETVRKGELFWFFTEDTTVYSRRITLDKSDWHPLVSQEYNEIIGFNDIDKWLQMVANEAEGEINSYLSQFCEENRLREYYTVSLSHCEFDELIKLVALDKLGEQLRKIMNTMRHGVLVAEIDKILRIPKYKIEEIKSDNG